MHLIWHSRGGRRRNHLWQIFWWSVEGCRFCGGSKIALSHWQSQWPLTQGWRYRAACDSLDSQLTAAESTTNNWSLLKVSITRWQPVKICHLKCFLLQCHSFVCSFIRSFFEGTGLAYSGPQRWDHYIGPMCQPRERRGIGRCVWCMCTLNWLKWLA